jgi:nicotinamidase-related amidase
MSERVWDRFLTAADKAHLARTQDRRVGRGRRPALLLIDLYRAVFGDKPEPLLKAIETWPSSCGLAAWEALPRIQRLLATARTAGIPVIHVTMLADSGMPGWYEAAHAAARPTPPDPVALDRLRRGPEIIDELAPIAGEVVLRKSSPSAFWGTPLVAELNRLAVDTLIVAGESTSGCVRASVVDGCTHRFRMQVVEECVFDRHEAPHAINLFDLHQKYADVILLADALAYIESTTRPARAASSEFERLAAVASSPGRTG